MVLIQKLLLSSKAIFLIDIQKQKQVISFTNGKKSKQTCLKALSLAPYFFNIFTSDLFLFIETTAPWNYADTNIKYYLDIL